MSIQAQTGNIFGKIRQVGSGSVRGQIGASGSISGTVSKPVGYVDYTGKHEVTPKFEKQTLQTASKVMRSDVTINEIPVIKVTNSSGGNTVIIGG